MVTTSVYQFGSGHSLDALISRFRHQFPLMLRALRLFVDVIPSLGELTPVAVMQLLYLELANDILAIATGLNAQQKGYSDYSVENIVLTPGLVERDHPLLERFPRLRDVLGSAKELSAIAIGAFISPAFNFFVPPLALH